MSRALRRIARRAIMRRVPSRVLLVDDDLAEISAVRRALGGREVVLATNASDALAELARGAPGLVLLAPACNGGEGTAVARALAATAWEVPLVVLGGGEDLPGAFRVLPRPLVPGALAAAVQEALEAARATASTPPVADLTALHSGGGAAAAERRAILEAESELRQASGVLDAERQRELDELARRRALGLVFSAEKLREVRRADYFAILGVAHTARPDEIQEAAEHILATLSDPALVDDAPQHLLGELEEIREVVVEAREVLSDPGLRAAYAAALDA